MATRRLEQIGRFLDRFVEQEIDKEAVLESLAAKKKLRVKLGIDPTASDLHIGHLVPIRLLRAFQDAGCKAVLVIGDYTARIGDPSGRDMTRPPLDAKEIKKNAKTYLKQLERVLDINKMEVRYQSEWYDVFKLSDTIKLLTSTSVSQIVEHNTFKERLANGQAFFMHEALYPLLQAYDSVAVNADVEIGALDQLFNIGMGRTVQKAYNQKPQSVLVTPYILGADGQKMSKSFNNTINLTDSPEEVFGKVMSIPDGLIESYARLFTEMDFAALGEVAGKEARDAKRRVALDVTKMLFGEKKSEKAQAIFDKTFAFGDVAEDLMKDIFPDTNPVKAKSLPLIADWTESVSEAKRLIDGGGLVVLRGGKVVWRGRSWGDLIDWEDGDEMKIGKRNFYRLRNK